MLEFAPTLPEVNDPLMGWWGRGDTRSQVALRFGSRDQAVAYADANGLAYDVEIPPVAWRRGNQRYMPTISAMAETRTGPIDVLRGALSSAG